VKHEDFDVTGYNVVKLMKMERKDHYKVAGAGDLIFGYGTKAQLGPGSFSVSTEGGNDPMQNLGADVFPGPAAAP
jgi:hypothetical protein